MHSVCAHGCVGTLLRKLEGGLRGVSHVIVDEIHERDINVRCRFTFPVSMSVSVVNLCGIQSLSLRFTEYASKLRRLFKIMSEPVKSV